MVATQTPTGLTMSERRDLVAAEEVIAEGVRTFVEVGNALKLIRDRRLYRDSNVTFAAYCTDRWGFSDSRARQLIAASNVAKTVDAETVTRVAVGNERQARELNRLPEEERAEAWGEAVGQSEGGEVTASAVRKVVDERLGEGEDGEEQPSTAPMPPRAVAEVVEPESEEEKPKGPTLLGELRSVCERYHAQGISWHAIKLCLEDLAEDINK